MASSQVSQYHYFFEIITVVSCHAAYLSKLDSRGLGLSAFLSNNTI